MSPRLNLITFISQNVTKKVLQPSYSSAPRLMGWNVPPEELRTIPEHWLSYPEPEPTLQYMLGISYIALTVVALTGNGLVIWIFGTTKALRSASNMFVVNLAIADFMMMAKTPMFIYNSFNLGYELGHFYCQIFATMGSYSGIVASCTNCCIAYDRYKTISSPLDGKTSKTKALVMVLFTWAYATPWTILPLLEIWGRFVPEGFLTSCTFDYLTLTMENQFFVLFIFIFAYCVPMFGIIFFYSQIVSHICNHEKALREQAKKMNVESLRSGDAANVSAEVRIAKTAIGICSLFVAAWTPYAVVALIGTFGNQAVVTPLVSMVPALCCKLVACFDPYVYAISHPRFRLELDKLMPFLKINEAPPPPKEDASAATEKTG